jgi:hypothetical protein
MFHVLTSTSEWAVHSDSISLGRVYLRPDVPEAERFLKNGVLDPEELLKYPALLMMEPQCRDTKPVRVVKFTSIKFVGNQVHIQYVNDPYVPTIPNDQAISLLDDCHISEMQLNHSCWRAVDEDFFKLLYSREQNSSFAHSAQPSKAMNTQSPSLESVSLTPSVFNFNALNAQDPSLVSVMMPFSMELKPVFNKISEACGELGYTCKRADDIWNHDHIIQDVVDLIASAKVVVCDLTGKNSNVFYEAGIAHSLGKNVILIAQSLGDVPFDLRHIRCLTYHDNEEGLEKLKQGLKSKLATL